MAHKLKPGNRAKDWWMSNKAVKISDGTPFTDGERHLLQLKEAKYIELNTGIRPR